MKAYYNKIQKILTRNGLFIRSSFPGISYRNLSLELLLEDIDISRQKYFPDHGGKHAILNITYVQQCVLISKGYF